MSRNLLGVSRNGCEVSVDFEASHAATHFHDTPKLLDAVRRIIPNLILEDELIRIDVDTGIIIGNTDLVETEEGDEIVYALRPNRTQYSRFVKHKRASPSSWVTLDLRKIGDSEYELYTAFVGRLTPSFPGGDYLPEQSREFWATHALVWGSQEIVPHTETTVCPWEE